MNLQMADQFYETGFSGTSTFVGCWPCDHCGAVVSAGLCSDECDELLAFCDDCCDKEDSAGGYTFVRPDAKRYFELLSGEKGWWNQA